MRAQEQLDVLPTQAKAVQFADLLLAELDGIAASEAAVPKMAVTGVKLVQTVMFSRRTVDVLCAAAKATSAHDQNKEKNHATVAAGGGAGSAESSGTRTGWMWVDSKIKHMRTQTCSQKARFPWAPAGVGQTSPEQRSRIAAARLCWMSSVGPTEGNGNCHRHEASVGLGLVARSWSVG